jgi:galactose-1-phosphate uridylyltransferase
MRDILHDELDALEKIQEDWHKQLDQIKKSVLQIAKKSKSFDDTLEEINILAADALADLTTRAISVGVSFGSARGKMK